MTSTERTKIMIPLLAAYEYGILAGGAYDSEERAEREKLMLNRLRHAVENAGFEMVAKKPAKIREAA
jgi:hypothetical protein